MFRKSFLLIITFLFVITVLSPDIGHTIPAFARKYGFSCSTCHVAVPKLKDYGDEFAGNAFQLPDDDEPVRAFRDVGDDQLLLQRDVPFGIRLDMYAQHRTDGDVDNDFQSPFGVKLLSGGNIAKDIGYYFYFYMDERGEVAGLEDAYVHFNNIKGSALDIMVGQFQICDPMFKRELRLTFEDYQIYKTSVGKSGANLTYDRGIILTYSLPTQTDFVVELVNGNGIEDAGNDRMFDNDSFKNVFARVSQGYSIFSLGMFAYTGEQKGVAGNNKFYYAGPDFSVGTEKVELSAQYVVRNDDDPMFTGANAVDYETSGVIGELTLNPFPEKSRLLGVLLYNSVTSDFPGFEEYETVTASVSYLLKTNFRMMAEVTQDLENEDTRFTIGYMAGF